MANGSVVVVGGTVGLGRELAHAYADEGREVVVTGRDQGRADHAASEIGGRTRGLGFHLGGGTPRHRDGTTSSGGDNRPRHGKHAVEVRRTVVEAQRAIGLDRKRLVDGIEPKLELHRAVVAATAG